MYGVKKKKPRFYIDRRIRRQRTARREKGVFDWFNIKPPYGMIHVHSIRSVNTAYVSIECLSECLSEQTGLIIGFEMAAHELNILNASSSIIIMFSD